MKDYSYTELKEMQDRAGEFRASWQRASEQSQNSLQEEKPKPDAHTEQNSYTKPHHIKMPVNMPPRESTAESRGSKASTDSNPASNFASANENSIIESILNDPDRAMLLPLLLLLKSEGANEGGSISLTLHRVIKAVKKGCKLRNAQPWNRMHSVNYSSLNN